MQSVTYLVDAVCLDGGVDELSDELALEVLQAFRKMSDSA